MALLGDHDSYKRSSLALILVNYRGKRFTISGAEVVTFYSVVMPLTLSTGGPI